MKRKKKNVFLTGASAGIGEAIAGQLLDEGYEVWGTSRDPARLSRFPRLHPVELHLEDPESIRAAWEQAISEAGQIDVVIQNAGMGLYGAIEEVSLEDSRRIWSVLVEGPLVLLKLAAGHLRPRREGMILGVSSLAAELPLCFSAHYTAGKAAFSALLAALWMELKPFGVRVVDLRPGDIRTSFNKNLPETAPKSSAYSDWAGKTWDIDQKLLLLAPGPEVIARTVSRLLRNRRSAPIVRKGSFFQAWISPLGPRFLPREILLQMIRLYYGLSLHEPENTDGDSISIPERESAHGHSPRS